MPPNRVRSEGRVSVFGKNGRFGSQIGPKNAFRSRRPTAGAAYRAIRRQAGIAAISLRTSSMSVRMIPGPKSHRHPAASHSSGNGRDPPRASPRL
jgi:hypothetical protein